MTPALVDSLQVSTPSAFTPMSASIVSSHWPAPSGSVLGRFGRSLEVAGRPGAVQWTLRRNCSLTPAQLGGFYLSMCAVSLVIAMGFAWHGAAVVLWFAGVELLVLAVALLAYARHASDADTVTLAGQELTVDQTCGSAHTCARFRTPWVSVEPVHGDGSLIELAGQGQSVLVGRFLRPEARTDFARELRAALRASLQPAPVAVGPSPDHSA